MLRFASERLLLIGDARRELQQALADAAPGARVTSVATVFDGIAELTAEPGDAYTTVIAAAEPIERRPEAAVRELRRLAPESRLLLFGHAGHEVLSRKMLQFGCDDYLVLPADPAEVKQVLGAPAMRLAPTSRPTSDAGTTEREVESPGVGTDDTADTETDSAE